jgi:hypothetical protein
MENFMFAQIRRRERRSTLIPTPRLRKRTQTGGSINHHPIQGSVGNSEAENNSLASLRYDFSKKAILKIFMGEPRGPGDILSMFLAFDHSQRNRVSCLNQFKMSCL